MILYFFYKNMVITIPHVLFSFYCGFSGQTVFDDWYITFYNMVFTALPLIVKAILDIDIYYKIKNNYSSKSISDLSSKTDGPFEIIPFIKTYYPYIYYIGQKNTIFTGKNFIGWLVIGIFQAISIFFICFNSFKFDMLQNKGYNSDIWSISITIFTSIVLV